MAREVIDKVKLGNTIREARERFNWTQERLAEYIGEPDKTIANIEVGKTMPTMAILLKIADALGYIVDDLVNGDVSIGPFRGDKEIAELFWDTTPDERKILIKTATALLKSMKENRPLRNKE